MSWYKSIDVMADLFWHLHTAIDWHDVDVFARDIQFGLS